MTAWSIEPDGVVAVLTKVQGSAETFAGTFAGVETAQTELNAGVGGDILVSSAVAVVDLISSETNRVQGINARILACATGAGDATLAYVNGDEEMAAQTQSAAVQAAESGDLSFFEGGR
ncbi:MULTISPECIES: DUF6507 family protein [unclassified Frigoribacterium]|jgi:hypothetical protein|uniref:DUF6507 family protein n=1 Tax=unclassified Frigoribacterium TaxID=2627005 RepID=UPI000701DED3|nr:MULTISPECIES: DUF6507 family protein [unclassified Frigoribacterium]KQM29624.1 hypothetical protein ASL10_02990 [Frigoribacterium sp. Leaf8]MBD8486909.1 hypothetical protein [Frigoribacterium sp. CFBP 8759]WAC52084.1 DUF6507 family protein [Frigoribacterium sp. SL97]